MSRSGERRQARGNVRAALSEVERHRWARDLDTIEWLAFSGALTLFVSAALVAGMPRQLVDSYERMAQVSRFVTAGRLRDGEPPEQVGIEAEVSDCIEFAHRLVASYLWRPFWTRLVLRRELKKLDKLVEKATEDTGDGRALRYKYWPS